jgi:Tol biopolymer transport system component
MENQVRELLRDIAEDIPPQREVPSRLHSRARLRIVMTVGATLVAVVALIFGSVVAVRSITASSPPRPANPRPTSRFAQVHGWIAYRDGSQIVAVDPADPARRISLGPANGADPIGWSRDGTRLLLRPEPEAVVYWQGGQWWIGTADTGSPLDIFVLDADGSLTRLTNDGRGTWGSFSPDGSMVAYACCGSAPGPYVVNANGGNARLLGAPCDPPSPESVLPQIGCGEPLPESAAWSPDGSRIAFIDFSEDSPLYGHHAYGLSFVNPDGTGLRKEAVHLPGEAGGLVWSPDGSQLAFWMVVTNKDAGPSNATGGDFPAQIFVINADGSGLRQITDGGDNRWPTWSPDGSRIAFARGGLRLKRGPDGSRAAFVPPGRQLFIIGPDGTDMRRVEGVNPDGAIAWNPLS